MIVRKAVIPAAGTGRRLLTATKEMPKEMLPVFAKGIDGSLILKPALQVIFESLHDFGLSDFCFLVGRSKRAVEDHFTPDAGFVSLLERNGQHAANELNEFYRKIRGSNIMFVNQPAPKGFGDAVHRAKTFTSNEPFMVHVGDDIIIAQNNSHLQRLVNVFEETSADATFLVERVKDPTKYGVICGAKVKPGIYEVSKIVEKPHEPPSDIATVGVYVFNSRIYGAIDKVEPDEAGEVQLTDAIMNLILEGGKTYAVELRADERRIDIGTPTSYWNALKETMRVSGGL